MERKFQRKHDLTPEEFEKEDNRVLFSIEYPEYEERLDPHKLRRLHFIEDPTAILKRVDHLWPMMDENERDAAMSHFWLEHGTTIKRVGFGKKLKRLLADREIGRWFNPSFRETLADRSTIILRHGASNAHAIFQYHEGRAWEGHLIIPKGSRGKAGLSIAREFLAWFDRNVGQALPDFRPDHP